MSVSQATLQQWFAEFEDLEGDDLVRAIYLADEMSYDMDEVLAKMDDVMLFKGTALEHTREYIDETGILDSLPENLQYYFDFKAFTRDMIMSGDIAEVTINKTNYVAWGV